MEQSNNFDPRRLQIKVKQTVPKSGTWFHGFQLTKEAAGVNNGCLLAECRIDPKEHAQETLLSAVQSILLTGKQAQKPAFRAGKLRS